MDKIFEIRNLYWKIFTFSTCLKILLIPSYKSTDFEVHRNWLAITNSLPIKEWYTNANSIWTLDYPPFFAWFEYILSFFAQYVDPEMVKIDNLNHDNDATLIFLRFSVIISDIIYALGVKRCLDKIYHNLTPITREVEKQNKYTANLVLPLLLLCNFGLFIVDHIHFQYNGFLFGILFFSFSYIIQGRYYMGAFLFMVLLNFKHIFIYSAPGYAIFYLKWILQDDKHHNSKKHQSSTLEYYYLPHSKSIPSYAGFHQITYPVADKMNVLDVNVVQRYRNVAAINSPPNNQIPNGNEIWQNNSDVSNNKISNPPTFNAILKSAFKKICLLLVIAILTFGLSFGPFIYLNEFGQVLQRMFPFGRGLKHEYWAPNIWALYAFADKILGFYSPTSLDTSNDRGVQDKNAHRFLPEITPLPSLALSISILLLPSVVTLLIRLKRKSNQPSTKNPENFRALPKLLLYNVAYSSGAVFLAGWHVHEKAALLITLPLMMGLCLETCQIQQLSKDPSSLVTSFTPTLNQNFVSLVALVCLSSHFSLLPLLPSGGADTLTAILLFIVYHSAGCAILNNSGRRKWSNREVVVGLFWRGFMIMYLGVFIFEKWGHIYPRYDYVERFPFLPLALISAYCGTGMVIAMVWLGTDLIALQITPPGTSGHITDKVSGESYTHLMHEENESYKLK
ncbi:unnamed protein product [Gordionus sp. m RMFG-2023]|uniref:probable dolichyl pyrophosphate Glc1Man9GlcNAc2 alpha-1,3-glucosyltransferase n=1 Tax=Gordionus sp. m RMFG-2023 TaxID=3053472 RepID=UPI0030E4177D